MNNYSIGVFCFKVCFYSVYLSRDHFELHLSFSMQSNPLEMFFIGTMGDSQLAPIVGQNSNEVVLIYPIWGDDLLKMLSS